MKARKRMWKPRRGQRLWFPGFRSRLYPPGTWRRLKRKSGNDEGGDGG